MTACRPTPSRSRYFKTEPMIGFASCAMLRREKYKEQEFAPTSGVLLSCLASELSPVRLCLFGQFFGRGRTSSLLPCNSRAATYLFFIFLLLFLSACSHSVPDSVSRIYTPMEGTFEAPLFEKARRDVFPEDLRSKPNEYRGQLLALTGIVRSSRYEGPYIVTEYDHHFWDWVEDYGPQSERVFLSPRGEGIFRCRQERKSFLQASELRLPKPGELGIVYGELLSIAKNKAILLDCAPIFKVLSPERFSTKIWDYGRRYLINGDRSDFQDLRLSGTGSKE